jgi:hypothetical protein
MLNSDHKLVLRKLGFITDVGRDSSVGIALRHGLDGQGIESR